MLSTSDTYSALSLGPGGRVCQTPFLNYSPSSLLMEVCNLLVSCSNRKSLPLILQAIPHVVAQEQAQSYHLLCSASLPPWASWSLEAMEQKVTFPSMLPLSEDWLARTEILGLCQVTMSFFISLSF